MIICYYGAIIRETLIRERRVMVKNVVGRFKICKYEVKSSIYK